MRSLHIAGTSRLHRMPAGMKLAALLVAGIVLAVVDGILPLAVTTVLAATVYAATGIGWRTAMTQLRPVMLTAFLVFALTLAFNGLAPATVVLLRILTLMLAGAAVTATTTTGAFIDVITAAARPLERIGLANARDIGLAIGLVIRFVPEILSRYEAIRDAHRARGLKVRPGTILIPLIILTLRNADEIAAAIDARAIRRQN